MRPASARFSCRPLTPARWPHLLKVFGERGACAGCWCMWPRLTRGQFQAADGALRKRAFRRVVGRGPPPGLLAYVGGEPAAWCALGPREAFARIESSRTLAPVDEQPVWSVVCFFIARRFRRRGLSVRLLREAIGYARKQGASILEGYPMDPGGRTADAFVWTGLASAFRRAGFAEVARRARTRPMMRYTLRGRPRRAFPLPRRRATRG